MSAPADRLLRRLREADCDPREHGSGWMARCPAHDDRRASLSLGTGKDGRALLHCHAGCATEDVLTALGLAFADLYPASTDHTLSDWTPHGPATDIYDYTDEKGELLFQVCRTADKQFPCRRPDPTKPQGWAWNLDGVRRVPFGLPRILEAVRTGQTIFVVEGERDVLAIERAGGVATCNPGGAGKWKPDCAEALRGAARVVVAADKDVPGRKHARAVTASLTGLVGALKVVEAQEGKDAADHLAAGHTLDEFVDVDLASEERAEATADGGATQARERPEIRITTDVETVVDAAEAAMLASEKVEIFQRGGEQVRVVRDGAKEVRGLLRSVGAPIVARVPEPHLFELMDRSARWLKWSRSAKDWVNALPPKWAVQVLAGRGSWSFPYLEGVTEFPALRPDGSVLERPGYDLETGLLYEPNTLYPRVPSRPTREQVRRAVEDLLDPFREFPFVCASDRAAALAAVLTQVGRHAIAGPCPMFAVLAPTPGTGKGLLVQVVVLLATGRSPVLMAAQHREEELKKIVTTIAMEGHASVLFDNAEGTFGGATLAAALTTTQWTGRILGVSKTITAPLLTVWYVTGNNLVFVGDTFRRVMPIHLDAGVERPEEREFERPDLLAYVRSQRPRLLVAALTVLRGFFEAGRPRHGLPRIGSFEAWDDLIRSCITWALEVDPCEGREAVREEGDADVEAMHALFAAWESAFPRGNAATVAAAIKAAAGDEALRNAIATTDRKEDGERLNGRALGYALRRWRGRVCGGRRLERVGNTSGGVLWRVVRVAGDPSAEERGSGDEADGGDDSTAPHSNTDSSPSNSPAYEWKHHHHDPHHHSEPPGSGDGSDDPGADGNSVEVLL